MEVTNVSESPIAKTHIKMCLRKEKFVTDETPGGPLEEITDKGFGSLKVYLVPSLDIV